MAHGTAAENKVSGNAWAVLTLAKLASKSPADWYALLTCWGNTKALKELTNMHVRQTQSTGKSWDLANMQAEGNRVYLRNEQK